MNRTSLVSILAEKAKPGSVRGFISKHKTNRSKENEKKEVMDVWFRAAGIVADYQVWLILLQRWLAFNLIMFLPSARRVVGSTLSFMIINGLQRCGGDPAERSVRHCGVKASTAVRFTHSWRHNGCQWRALPVWRVKLKWWTGNSATS